MSITPWVVIKVIPGGDSLNIKFWKQNLSSENKQNYPQELEKSDPEKSQKEQAWPQYKMGN